MTELHDITFNIAAFISGLFILEFGPDESIDNAAIISARLTVSPSLITIALLTSGMEWEKLIVAIAAISQHQSSLANGSIVRSSHLSRIS